MKSYEYMAAAIETYLKANPTMKPYLLEHAAGVGRNTVYDILARRKNFVYLDTWNKIKTFIENNS